MGRELERGVQAVSKPLPPPVQGPPCRICGTPMKPHEIPEGYCDKCLRLHTTRGSRRA
jgi:hypothetical protein